MKKMEKMKIASNGKRTGALWHQPDSTSAERGNTISGKKL